MRLYRLISYVESHVAFEDVETFVLLVMDVKHAPVPIGSEYLYQRGPPTGLLLRGLYGGKQPEPPPRLAFTRFGCAKVMLWTSSSALSMAPVLTWSSVADIVSFSFPYTVVCRERCQRTKRLSRLKAQNCAIISSMPRKYEMKRRAERMLETRQRITEATVELHQSVGPARTTVSAIAEKAGVQRHTYYAHFPELKDLYQACTAHYLERNPLPDPSRWVEIPGPEERLRRALSEVYAYYRGNEAMLTNVLRDMPLDPVLQANNVLLFRHWEAMRDTIADAFEASGERHEALLAAIALALDLQTWRTLVGQQGLEDDLAVELMVGMVRCLMLT
jgi:AcrR family transcriptional regulator